MTNQKTFEQIIIEERRLIILCLLMGPCGRAANETLLLNMLNDVGLVTSSEKVRSCLEGLEKIGAVRIEWRNALAVIRLTARGAEIAKGLIECEGVAKPHVDCVYWDWK